MAGELSQAVRQLAREIARKEIASLCGLVMRRLQDLHSSPGGAFRGNEIASVFAEALRDFGGTPDEPGD